MKAEFVPIQNGVKRKDLEPFTVFHHGSGESSFMVLPPSVFYTKLLCVDLRNMDICDTGPEALCYPKGKFVFEV